jgi:hypothetical protein
VSDKAKEKARDMVEQMRRKGDNEGADTWLRIIVTIGELGEAPEECTNYHKKKVVFRNRHSKPS